MVELTVQEGTLDIQLVGLHRVWALRSRVSVPLSAITDVRRPPDEVLRSVWKGWRAPGTHFPGLLVAGTYYRRGERHFWDVRRSKRAIEIDLTGAEYDRIYVEVDDPDAAIATIEAARRTDRPS